MKIANVLWSALAATVLLGAAGVHAEVNVQINFNELNGYGEWINIAGYGTVWRPDADRDWRPFTYGHWVYSNDGWMWDSDEPFGWIVCHYGDWLYDDDEGWVWLPGYSWSPARVRWRVTDNEVGWAPIFPRSRNGHYDNNRQMEWTFAPLQFFTSFEIHDHLEIRTARTPNEEQGYVSARPPERRFIQRGAPAPIVSINLDKINITARERPLVRVEVRHGERSNVEVPVGPKYKRVIIQNQSGEEKIRSYPREGTVRREQFDKPSIRTEVHPSIPEVNTEVRPADTREDPANNRDNNRRMRSKSKVEVRTR